MQKLQFAITIAAPKEKVWSTMLDKETYEIWSEAFMPGSSYVGDWNEGSKIMFVAPNKEGKMEGMISRIKENRQNEFISIEHLGFIKNGIEDTTSEQVQAWIGALENYTFQEHGDATELIVDLDISDSMAENMKEEFEQMWPKALQKLKELAEN